MGILNNKPKKEIEAGTPQKRGFFRFFDIYFRKFMHFGKANLLYSATLIPTFIIVFVLMFIPVINFYGSSIDIISMTFVTIMCVNLYISLWGMGPSTAGITYIMRNYAREEHCWLWNDFKENFKINFRQALIVFIIDIVIAVIAYMAIVVYASMPGLMGALKYVVIMLLVIYTMMHLYIYPMMVTFELSLIDLYKNALLFAISKMPINIFVIAVQFVLHVAFPMWAYVSGGTHFVLLVLLILMLELVVTQGFSSFLVNFSVFPAIKKYMLDVVSSQNSEDKGEA